MRRLKAKPLIIIALSIILGFGADRYIPSQHLPWRALNPHAPIGLSTRMQLLRVSLSPSAHCSALTDQVSEFKAPIASPHKPDNICGWTEARNISQSGNVNFADMPVMQCPLGLGVHIWTQSINQRALHYYGAPLAKIHHAGTYSCRRQNGNSSGQWSEHAFANAFDVTGFELEDGRVISVLKGWNGDQKDRLFLRDARNTACKIFRVTLSPDFNTAHADHFHLDMGPVSTCR